ncbi:MAG: ParB/RepB/Spo0J family partition protein [Chromatiales bacterium]|nr:ParB/RepB/Spo0J family partition protein [Chromatiales bacterium]
MAAKKSGTAKRTGLGRGLEALLGGSAGNAAPEAGLQPDPGAAAAPASGARELPVDLLQRGAYQPRQDFDPGALEELAASIRAQGLVQPVVVRPLAREGKGPQRYEIVAGERRWRAAQLAGLQSIPAVVRDLPDSAAIAVALIENIQREDLNPLEEAQALQRLVEEFALTHEQAAEAVGRSRAAVSNLLRLLELTEPVQDLLRSGALDMGHARALLGLTDARRQAEVGRLVASKGLSVRETERLVKKLLTPAGPQPEAPAGDGDIRRLESDLAEKLGARVAIRHKSGGRGSLVISYHSLDELDGILKHIL